MIPWSACARSLGSALSTPWTMSMKVCLVCLVLHKSQRQSPYRMNVTNFTNCFTSDFFDINPCRRCYFTASFLLRFLRKSHKQHVLLDLVPRWHQEQHQIWSAILSGWPSETDSEVNRVLSHEELTFSFRC